MEAIDAALAEGPRVAAKALVLLTDLLHESLAAKAAEASGRPTYDGHLHSARPARMFWDSEGGFETQLCWSVLGHPPAVPSESSECPNWAAGGRSTHRLARAKNQRERGV